MTNPLFDGLLATGRTTPDKCFAILPDGREFTYADVEAVSARFANALVALGVEPGDRVAVQADKSIEALMLYLGTVRAGGVFLPLNTAYTPTEIDYFLNDAKPRVFVCDPAKRDGLAATAEGAGARLETLGARATDAGSLNAQADAASGEFVTVARQPSDLAAILYTSGTTGRSKGAMLTQDNLLSNAEVLRDYWRFTADDVLLHLLPIFHTHGLFVASNTAMIAGGTMIFLPKFDVEQVFKYLPQATAMMGVPTFYTRLLADERLNRERTAHMRLFTSGSAPLLAETHRAFEERTGQRILERYGMTETNMSTSNPYEGERRAGTVGFPLPGVELRIVDADTAKPLPDGEIGVIEVKGPNVFCGYWQMPEKTAAEFRADGFFITGDLGLIDPQGYVTIVGRGKDLIISGGFNIYPKEVELALDELPGVVESAVIGVPHPDFGEGVVGVVVAERPLDEAELTSALAERLARFKQPKRIVFVDELPRNTMGKVQKNILRDRFADLLGDK
ncbi:MULTISPECIES: malonate--CoA ligase [Aurantimonas]|uniref:Acyl-CoA synthetase (AMP-forming)/AMP-acid ligase II n=1 Tax=Aurantimonas coralicida TaxID=182270 RepID=A0A0P0YZU3_9HYPH|nr:malonyl-CoA synthase [Aurantimonas coralicida]BAT27116.1 acyl-CoA synthetase (AMP-forming)/AMP-acid ligase II [Aurantimonas coralicida]